MSCRFPVVFLDIDGVLNSWLWDGRKDGMVTIDPRAVATLNTLLAGAGARVVVSSTWRLRGFPTVRRELMAAGVPGELVIGVTPRLPYDRGHEIAAWLGTHGRQVSSFVILDDDSDMGRLRSRLVQTSMDDGLQPRHVEEALEVLRVPYSATLSLPPEGAYCLHPQMRCPNGASGCGNRCGHWWCPDCGVSWDDDAEQGL